ncbi:MAG: hypothetical protein GF313_11355, partial [Caldithrix sp.]|nr:hypothetical protein [Caldithrix sp.]
MRKLIIIIGVSISIIGILLTASPYILKAFHWDEPLKRVIIPKIFNVSQNDIDFDEFSFGLNTLEVRNVAVSTREKQFRVLIEKISFNLNVFNWIKNPKQPEKILTRIQIIKPRLILSRQTEMMHAPDSVAHSTHLSNMQEVLQNLNSIGKIERLHINNGKVIYKTPQGQFYALADKLNGWIIKSGLQNLELTLKGHLSSSNQQNFNILSQIDLNKRRFNTLIQFTNYRTNKLPVMKFTENGHIDNGIIDGEVLVQNHHFILDSTNVNADLIFREFDGQFRDIYVNHFSFNMTVENNKLNIADGQGFVYDSPFTFNLNIANIWYPRIRGQFKTNRFDIQKLNDFLSSKSQTVSDIGLAGDFDLNIPQKKGLVDLQVPRLEFPMIGMVSDLNFRLRYKNQQYRLALQSPDFRGFQLKGNAYYNAVTSVLGTHLNLHNRFGNHQIFDELTDKQQDFNVNLHWSTKRKKIAGTWNYTIHRHKQDSLYVMEGHINGDHQNLEFTTDRSDKSDTYAIVRLKNVLENPTIQQSYVKNIPLHIFVSDPMLRKPLKRLSSEASLSGQWPTLNGTVRIEDTQNKLNALALKTRINGRNKDMVKARGTIQLKNLQGSFNADISAEKLTGQFNLQDELSGKIDIDLTKKESLNGQLDLNDFNLVKLFRDTLVDGDFRMQGHLDGNISLSGTLHKPFFQSDLTAEKFVFNDVGYYQTQLTMRGNRNELNIDTLSVSLNNVPLMNGSLYHQFNNKALQGSFRGQGINIEQLWNTFSDQQPAMTGVCNFEMEISGSLEDPVLNSTLNSKHGTLFEIPYDQIHFDFVDYITNGFFPIESRKHAVSVNTLDINRVGTYSLSATGHFLGSGEESLDMDVHFEGDAFYFIPYLHDFFQDGTCNSDIELHLVGKPDQIRLKSGKALIERGELWLGNVAPHIENINGGIHIQESSNEVNFEEFRGVIDGTAFTINTVRDVIT